MIKNQFFPYLKAVGTGPKGNRDLSFQESKDMMLQILRGEVHPENIAAFLLGWRLKPETVEEFKGALCALDEYTITTKIKNSIELGYAFDGKTKNSYIFPLIGALVKKFDINLVVVGDDLQVSKDGITIKNICESFNLEENIFYFDRKNYLKELHDLTQLRQRLALRSAFNTLEKLPHVSESEFAITGVHHKPYVEKYQKMYASRYKKFALIQGNEGSPELFSKGNLWVSENSKVLNYMIDPSFYGIKTVKSTQLLSLEESLNILQDPSKNLQMLARLNAAILLFVVNKARSIDEAYQLLEE